jgi:MoaA/NifB/PqqE/SkfB family radical SAM enzyme
MKISSLFAAAFQMNLFRAFVPLAGNFLSLISGRKNSIAPFYISWLLTYRCNRKCGHCDWVWSRTDKETLAKELPQEKRMEMAEQIGRSWTWGVTLSGGEPLLDPALLDIISCLKRHHKIVNLCTNGVLLSQYAEDLIKSKTDTITVSFDSHEREKHDSIRGVKGTFDSALAGIEAVRSLRKGRRPNLIVKGVISPSNMYELVEHVSFFKKCADKVSFQPIQYNYGHQVHDTGLLFSPQHEEEFRAVIQKLCSAWPEFNTPYYLGMADYLFSPEKLLASGRFRCLFASSMSLGIDPYGNVGGCLGQFISGNCGDQSLAEIWTSKKNYEIQINMRSPSRKCICWNYSHYLDTYFIPVYNFFNR